jgi:hypothetical protein
VARARGAGVASAGRALAFHGKAASRAERGRPPVSPAQPLGTAQPEDSGYRIPGSAKWNVAPYPSFGVAHSRPPWASTIERQIDNPIPMPAGFVVKKALNS